MGSAAGSSCWMARSTARAARSCPAPARTWRIRTRFVVGVAGRDGSKELTASPRVGVRDMLETELRSIAPPGDADDVEPDRPADPTAPAQIHRRRARDVLALLPVHRQERGRAVRARAELHLDEDDRLAVASDQVDLPSPLPRVPVDDFISAERAIGLRHPLAAPGRPLPPHPRPRPRAIGPSAAPSDADRLLHEEELPDGAEAPPVDGTRAVAAERLDVLRGAVALVVGEAVLGEAAVLLDHQTVAGHLGDDGGRGHGLALRVAVDHRLAGDAVRPDGVLA